MDLTTLATQLFTAAVIIGAIMLWAASVVMIIAGAWMIVKGRGGERLFGLALVAGVLVLLPTLIEDYPYELASAANVSWDKTMPEVERLGQKMVATFSNAMAGVETIDSDPPPPEGTPFFGDILTPPVLSTTDPYAGGSVPEVSQTPEPTEPILLPAPYLSPTPSVTPAPTQIMQGTPTLAPTATPNLLATVNAVATAEAAKAAGFPPTPIIMTPSGN